MLQPGVLSRITKAFTLLELIVVVIVVSILAAVALPRFFRMVEFSRSAEGFVNLGAMRQAMERCYFQCTSYCNCNWNVMMLENPGKAPNAHFVYTIDTRGHGWYVIKAARNTRDKGDGTSAIFLKQDLNSVKRWGTGVFGGIQ